jgi:hypothetical protein
LIHICVAAKEIGAEIVIGPAPASNSMPVAAWLLIVAELMVSVLPATATVPIPVVQMPPTVVGAET